MYTPMVGEKLTFCASASGCNTTSAELASRDERIRRRNMRNLL